jgi:hypothetical protein
MSSRLLFRSRRAGVLLALRAATTTVALEGAAVEA